VGLWFEPASLAAIAGSLRVLTAANCGISDPAPLAVLTRLHTLDLSGNAIASLDVLQPVLGALGCLQDLDLRRNPCTHGNSSKHRDCVILGAADSLLDGAEVTPAHRAFLRALHSRKARAAHQQQHTAQHLEHRAGGMSPRDQQHAQACSSGDFAVAALTPRSRAAQLGLQQGAAAAGPVASGLTLQLPGTLQACRGAGCVRPPPAAGFKPAPGKEAAGRARAAAGVQEQVDLGGGC
jgi:hypothetical protein